MKASVALLTLDGAATLPAVLASLARQSTPPLEVLAIDSGSRDPSVTLLREAGVQVHEIARDSFSHPGTRNRAARLARGSHVVFLTQDAVPAGERWLEALLRPFETFPGVAGVYARQVPRTDRDLHECKDLGLAFGVAREVRTLPADRSDYARDPFRWIRFSNACAAYPRDRLLEQPFDETLAMAEDQEWARRALEAGGTLVYEPDACVLHSHDHPLSVKVARHRNMGAAFARFLSPTLGRRPFPWGAIAYDVLSDAWFAATSSAPVSRRLRCVATSPLHRAATHVAYWRGWNAEAAARRRSAEPVASASA